jgi:hypothetical protein
MSSIEPLTIQQFTALTPQALQDYTINLSSAISTAMETDGYIYDSLKESELLLLSPSELYTYNINLSTLRAAELKTNELVNSLADIRAYELALNQSTITGLSSISYSNTLVTKAQDAYIASSQAIYNASLSTIDGLSLEIAAKDAEITSYTLTINGADAIISTSEQIIKTEMATMPYSQATLSTINGLNAADEQRAAYYSKQLSSLSSISRTFSTKQAIDSAAYTEE